MAVKDLIIVGGIGLGILYFIKKSSAKPSLQKAILYEDLRNTPRTTEETVQIVADTGAELILRSATRWDNDSFHGTYGDILRNNISAIKSRFPDTKIIGNVYWQVIGRGERDDITGKIWTDQEVYNLMVFNPQKYGIDSITKCQYNCYDYSCECLGPGEVQGRYRYIPDMSVPEVQTLFIHQVQRMLELGCDGVWIDWTIFNAYFVRQMGGSESTIQYFVDSVLYTIEEIRKLRTKDGKIPMISSWIIPSNDIKYYRNSPYWHDNFYDFVTIGAPYVDEIKEIKEKQNYDEMINNVKDHHNGVPIIAYIDWWWYNHPMWYFSQWHPGYTDTTTDCCHQDNFIKRHNFQISVLRYFTEFFKSKGIIWAYPIHCPSCSTDTCPGKITPDSGMCCTKAFGIGNYYDALAPEFQTYSEIVRLMNL